MSKKTVKSEVYEPAFRALYAKLERIDPDVVAQAIRNRRFLTCDQAIATMQGSGGSKTLYQQLFRQTQSNIDGLLREMHVAGQRVEEEESPETDEAELAALRTARENKIVERNRAKETALSTSGRRAEAAWSQVDRLNGEIREMEDRVALLKIRVGERDGDGEL
ncbi:MAG: hypothetical protein PHI23_04745 [Candidatus Peribacteraceae bacterium]|nr:hypothetical protein [Candidatus Peribacteraceae bacterium]